MIMAVMPRCPRAAPVVPPALLSFIPPVKGLFAPMDTRLVLTRLVPLKTPGAMISLLSGPRGSHVGGTSALIIVEVSPLPPSPRYCCGTSFKLMDFSVMLTLINFISVPLYLRNCSWYYFLLDPERAGCDFSDPPFLGIIIKLVNHMKTTLCPSIVHVI